MGLSRSIAEWLSVLEAATGIEPVCTALQAVASPLGHTATVSPLRADDGIRTRDPHLGKVMRYQLRHIRILRAARRVVSVVLAVRVETLADLPSQCQINWSAPRPSNHEDHIPGPQPGARAPT